MFFIGSFSTNSATVSEFDFEKVVLFHIKVFGRNIIKTTLARHFINRAHSQPTQRRQKDVVK